jgi:alpha-tubulin suppressor-like RCC1 family protein
MSSNLSSAINYHTSSSTSILLVDQRVPDYQKIIDSVNTGTFPIVYSAKSTRQDLDELLSANFASIDRIGICFVSNGNNQKIFLSSEPFDSPDNVNWMIESIRRFNIRNIDFLACSTLTYPRWTDYYSQLTSRTNVSVGASNDRTGNIRYGGDWTMESTGTDIELIYFTQMIECYKYLLDASANVTMIIRSDGTVWGAGNNEFGQLGPSVLNPLTTMLVQVPTPTGSRVVAVSCGYDHTVVLLKDGTVWGIGSGGYGQLGHDSTDNQTEFLQMIMPVGYRAVAIACGYYFTIVLMEGGTVWGTGDGSWGKLGNGGSGNKRVLTRMTIPDDYRATAISCGINHTIVLMDGGTVWGTGHNDRGQLGVTYSSEVDELQLMNMSGEQVAIAISCGVYHSIVLMESGTVWSTGYNDHGQLGVGDTESRCILTEMLGSHHATAISGGYNNSLILTEDRKVWGTGSNDWGQLGTGDDSSTLSLVEMPLPPGHHVAGISCGTEISIILMNDGTVWGTGNNDCGRLSFNTDIYAYNMTESLVQMIDSTDQLVSNSVAIMGSTVNIYTDPQILLTARIIIFFFKMRILYDKLNRSRGPPGSHKYLN